MRHHIIDFAQPLRIDAPEPLLAHYLPGTGSRLVVSLAGVGTQRDVPPPMEFIGTASGDGENHVLFVSDTSRSWMNGPGVAQGVVDLVTLTRDRHGLSQVVTLGNSMGGFAALVLADLMPVDTAIAFAPQFSAHPDIVPEETRWTHFREMIADWPHLDVGPLRHRHTNLYVFHGDAANEAPHWLRFPQRREINHFILDGLDHNVARALQKRSLLRRTINAAIHHRPRVLRRALQCPVLGRGFTAMRRETYQMKHPEVCLAQTRARTEDDA